MILSDFDCFRDDPMIKFKEEVVEGISYTTIAYMIGNKELWDHPLARETRGITFETKSGKCVSRPFAKFFNVGEREEVSPAIVKANMVEVYEKRDGSMLTPIFTKNKNILFKTKKSFYSDVANQANSITTGNISTFCRICLGVYNSVPIFEFTHPDHRIVLDYPGESHFTLLAIRQNNSGEYLDYDTMKSFATEYGIPVIKKLEMTWDQLQKSVEDDKGIEGYVILLKDGSRVKLKTAWYSSVHRVMTEIRVRDVAEAVVNETIDDLKSLVALQGKSIDPLDEIEKSVVNELLSIRSQVNNIAQSFIGELFKTAAIELQGSPYFALIMDTLRGKEPKIIDYWRKNYLKLYSLRVVYNPSFSKKNH